MRSLLITALSLWFSSMLSADHAAENFELISYREKEMTIKVSIKDFKLQAVKKDGERIGFLPVIEKGAYKLNKGYPDLQHLTTSLIREGQNAELTVLNKKYKTFSDIDILPSRGNIYRNQDPDSIPYWRGRVYKEDGFFPSVIAGTGKPYHFRDFSGVPLQITPMQYNPVSKELRLYTELIIKVTFSGPGQVNEEVSREFIPVYQRHFLNFQSTRYSPLGEKGEMLVFTHPNFDQEIRPFVDWKTKTGIAVEQVRIDTLGSGTAQDIQSYISQYYQNHNLVYVLLVGDAQFVPTNNLSSGDSDNAYGYLAGNDSYPELFVGRFSAEDNTDVQTMVQRTLMYESGPVNAGSWINKSLGLASKEGPGDNNEMDYEHVRGMHNQLQGYTYTHLLEMYEGSQGGNDAPGDPVSSMVSQGLNQGIGNVLYTGHGSSSSWITSGFSSSDVDQLTNTTAWPFILAVACVNGDFAGNTCFAEHWLRAEHNGTPTGAIAAFMSTINQSWNPPMRAQDEMVDILVESSPNNIKRTFGGLSVNGCMAMNDAYGSQGDEITDTWVIFGDPSVMIRTDTSRTLSPAFTQVIFPGDTALTVSSSEEDARVALSRDGELLDVQYVQNGMATLNFSAFTGPDTLTLAMAAYNHDIFMDTIFVSPADNPYVILNDVNIKDGQGNIVQGIEQGEAGLLDVTLENVGLQDAHGIGAVLSAVDTNVIILNDSAAWGQILSKDSVTQQNAYEIQVKPGATNGHRIDLMVKTIDNTGESWKSSFPVPVHAPQPEAISLEVDNDSAVHAPGRLVAGEKASIITRVINKGKAEYSYAWCTLLSSSTYVDVIEPFETIQHLAPGHYVDIAFKVRVSPDIPDGTTVRFDLDVDGGDYSTVNSFYECIGNLDEDFHTKDFTQFPWNLVGANAWEIDTAEFHSGDASAVSGLNYGQHNASSILFISVDVLKDDSISFYRKTSSEADYDYMNFFINNDLQARWSGFKDWERFSYPVSAGSNVFKWTYEKDSYGNSGADKAWLDDISFPFISMPASVEENIHVSSARVYPNPAGETQTLEFVLGKGSGVCVEILDITGRYIRTVIDKEMTKGRHKLEYSLSSLSPGMYFVRLSLSGNEHMFKIMHR
ncbi:MAG: C25 family cysteine peptidase [Bacteroidales bacterium]